MDYTLIAALENMREEYGKPMKINSAYRTRQHNTNVGGVSNSQHRKGRAVDVHIDNQEDGDRLEELAHKYLIGGVGRYNSFIHIDSRGTKAYWDKRTS
ncbi:MAG: DUF882 domain-containing protein [Gammaproteobacteria bacterium]|nr:DUF882 domain-containing protein [Gammaproteobacteria bacterium]